MLDWQLAAYNVLGLELTPGKARATPLGPESDPQEAKELYEWPGNLNLATTCRNILGVSLSRPGTEDSRVLDGVLKVENRRPRHIPVFRAR